MMEGCHKSCRFQMEATSFVFVGHFFSGHRKFGTTGWLINLPNQKDHAHLMEKRLGEVVLTD